MKLQQATASQALRFQLLLHGWDRILSIEDHSNNCNRLRLFDNQSKLSLKLFFLQFLLTHTLNPNKQAPPRDHSSSAINRGLFTWAQARWSEDWEETTSARNQCNSIVFVSVRQNQGFSANSRNWDVVCFVSVTRRFFDCHVDLFSATSIPTSRAFKYYKLGSSTRYILNLLARRCDT